jgi:DNA-binding transcriptional regulator YiaG
MMPHNEQILTARAFLQEALDAPTDAVATDLIISAGAHMRGALRDLGGGSVPEEIALDKWAVRRYTTEAGLTANKLAARFGISAESVRRWTREERWSYDHAVQLAEYLGVDLMELRK